MEKDSASMTKAHEQIPKSGKQERWKKRKGGNRCRKVQEDLCRKKKIKSENGQLEGLIKKKDKEDDCIH
jgi:hypothetical protein